MEENENEKNNKIMQPVQEEMEMEEEVGLDRLEDLSNSES
jgi:hypothetical protein